MALEIREVAPGDLIVAANVRREVALSKEFVASVKEHGVKVPVLVQEGLTGLEVIDGQRRTLAAVEAGLSLIPVVVQAPVADEGQRIVDQLVVNEHRSGLTNADQVEAIRDLALFGMSASAIARKVGEKKATVDVALKVAAAPEAVELMREHQVSLDDAAGLAEVAAVDAEYAAELVEKLQRGWNVDHSVRQWRQERQEQALRDEIAATEGVELIDMPEFYDDDPRALRNLYTDEAMTERLADVEEKQWREIAGDGLCGFPTWDWVGGERKLTIGYAVRGWRDRGLFGRDYGDSTTSSKPSTPEEAEAQKAERRAARERTKAWAIATESRLVFLREVLQRKVLPVGWERVVAQHVCRSSVVVSWPMAKELLQGTEAEGEYVGYLTLRRMVDENPTRAGHVALGVALAEKEGGRDFDRKGWQTNDVADYLRMLAGWGYQLTDVELELTEAEAAKAA